MSVIPTPTSKPDDLFAAFDRGFNGVTPADVQLPPIAQRIEPFRERILARRKMGFSWAQIDEVLAKPPISLHVSPTTLRKLFSEKPKHRRKSKAAQLQVLPLPGENPTS